MKKNLALRLLSVSENFKHVQIIEKKDFNFLEKYFEKKHIFDLSKMYYDYEVSNGLVKDYLEIDGNNYVGKSIITSYDTWDINLSEGSCKKFDDSIDIHTELSVFYHIYQFSKFYNLKYANKRYLINHPHLGSLRMTFNCQKKVELIMLPIHGMILELIEKDKILVSNKIIKKIKSFTSYSEKFINQLITSLIETEIILIDKVGKGMITINYDYNKLDEIDVTKYFFENSYLDEKWNEERKQELALRRENILCSLINSFIKKNENETGNKYVKREEIFKSISSGFNLFKIDQKLYKHVLDYMVEKDYISYRKELDSYCKLYY